MAGSGKEQGFGKLSHLVSLPSPVCTSKIHLDKLHHKPLSEENDLYASPKDQ
jgi:hypothetical protein